ncbi:hypothetical protein Patl1_02451 [Pistacia atlantica]|uniref:Uncharacterized protein n=1 Tax=Pistacia atlantica TaxID=434234 RepID=A0ACC1C817_9ROSI|nr:hypothetical protein Patl1_02451 [Pistacia atlantica]
MALVNKSSEYLKDELYVPGSWWVRRIKEWKHGIVDWHNLHAILHIVAGWNGEKEKFKLRVKRSMALVNKSSEYLKDELYVPCSWWVEKNKGMVRDEDGEWVQAPPAEEDLPILPNFDC